MNKRILTSLTALGMCLYASQILALDIPEADGSDGELVITSHTTIKMQEAADGVWNGANPTPGRGRGVYDKDKWAVVYRYSKVSIQNGAVLSFELHPSRAPVVWLVKGDVIIPYGQINLNGWNSGGRMRALGGPGGFRAGTLWGSAADGSAGMGPGGGDKAYLGSVAGYGTPGVLAYGNDQVRFGGVSYGSPTLLPLLGGSGAGGGNWDPGSGGGAILIAAQGVVTVGWDGSIVADGGERASGGGIRIIAESINGGGIIRAEGRSGGAQGRIRLEARSSGPLRISPPGPVVSPLPIRLWPDERAPQVRIASVGGTVAPPEPRGEDVGIPDGFLASPSGLTTVTLVAKNVRPTAYVVVRGVPALGNDINAVANKVSGDDTESVWSAQVQAPVGLTTVYQATARQGPVAPAPEIVKSFVIEAEDFDFGRGQHAPEADTMPYYGGRHLRTEGADTIDYGQASHDWIHGPYRFALGAGFSEGPIEKHAEWEMTVNYRLGWMGGDEWFNYTRVMPAGRWKVFAALSNGDGREMRSRLVLITSGLGTNTQGTEVLGSCRAASSGAWGANVLVPFVNGNGQAAIVETTGAPITFRVDSTVGDFDYLQFVPVAP
jgi:hypothetical protein